MKREIRVTGFVNYSLNQYRGDPYYIQTEDDEFEFDLGEYLEKYLNKEVQVIITVEIEEIP